MSTLIENERHDTLRDALIIACIEFCPLEGPSCVVRIDCAVGFQALVNDKLLKRHNIEIELGRTKNVNKNPIADKAVKELEDEIVKMYPRAGRVSNIDLAIATSCLNTRIRNRGLSSREMWYQRDQFTNAQLPIEDLDIITSQHKIRQDNPRHSERSKAAGHSQLSPHTIRVGDLVYLYSDKDKHKCRERYIVVAIEGEWCTIKKFSGSQLRKTSYRVNASECFIVPSNE